MCPKGIIVDVSLSIALQGSFFKGNFYTVPNAAIPVIAAPVMEEKKGLSHFSCVGFFLQIPQPRSKRGEKNDVGFW